MNEDRAILICLVVCASRNTDKVRFSRLISIMTLNWGISAERTEGLLDEAIIMSDRLGHPSEAIKAATKKITPKKASHVFAACMDVLSSGNMLTRQDIDIIYFLKKGMNIPEKESEAAAIFCNIRSGAMQFSM